MAGAEADAGLLLELKRSRWLLVKRCTVSVEDDGCCKCEEEVHVFSLGFLLYVWPAAGVNKNGLGFYFITSEGRLIGPVSLDWHYSSYRSDHSVKIIFLIRKTVHM